VGDVEEEECSEAMPAGATRLVAKLREEDKVNDSFAWS